MNLDFFFDELGFDLLSKLEMNNESGLISDEFGCNTRLDSKMREEKNTRKEKEKLT